MSRFNPINVDQESASLPWFALQSAIPRLMDQSYHDVSPTLANGTLSSQTPGQAASISDATQSVQQTESPWMQRILRGSQEPLDFYIARLEAECSNNPRPVQAESESRDEYAHRLWLRVYNKYCKRRSRHNERANYAEATDDMDNGNNRPRRGRNQQRSQSSPAGPSRGDQQPTNVDGGHGNGQQQPPLRSYNDQEGRAGTDALRFLQARAAAGARLHEHIRERARQGVNMEQFFRLALDIPLHETVFDGTTMRFHNRFAEIASFANVDHGGARMVLRPDLANNHLPGTPTRTQLHP